MAIVLGEPDFATFRDAIDTHCRMGLRIYIPASVLVEAGIVAESRGYAKELDAVLDTLRAEVTPLDHAIAQLARQAYRQFGRGFHKAALNFGDCMSYATARYLRLPLLYKGDDFRKTNIPPALPLPN
ncbi:MAG TPA: type II toxin-antitoxin system VapC family toxin [Bryobacteraceae bacterium]|nr:type II toxin-antitoxin system VapC family toxin [Bryobacteraceae bacterium]